MSLVDQEGSLGSDDTGQVLAKYAVDEKPEATDLHATMVETHHDRKPKLLHSIEGQSTLEDLPVTDEDIMSEACYAKRIHAGNRRHTSNHCSVWHESFSSFHTLKLHHSRSLMSSRLQITLQIEAVYDCGQLQLSV